jgi:hypothetical protein
LFKHLGSNATEALVGERLLMYGVYYNLKDPGEGPAFFAPTEVFEKFVRRTMARLHLMRKPYVYTPSEAVSDDQKNYFGVPTLNAPTPYKPRGTMSLQFSDDFQNRSTGLLKVYFKGTASATFKPKIEPNVSVQPVPVPSITAGVGIELGSFTRTAVIEPVRDDPVVSARVVTGSELAKYLAGYLPHVVESSAFAIPGNRDAIQDGIDQIVSEVAEAGPDGFSMDPAIENVTMEPGERQTITVRGGLSPERRAVMAIETSTADGEVMSDLLELTADEEGRIF